MPKNLRTLASSTDKNRKQRSQEVVTKLLTAVFKPGEYLREYVFQTYTSTTPQNKYRTTISPLLPKQPDLKGGLGNVSVSCSCADYKYRWEVANHIAGASKVVYSNGARPVITNPSNKAMLCKHLLACMPTVLARNPADVRKYNEQLAKNDEKNKLKNEIVDQLNKFPK